MKKYTYMLLLPALITGCDKNENVLVENEEKTPVELVLTYAADPAANTTYRVMCYDEKNETYISTGTYRFDPARPRSMMPCEVDTDGTWTGTDDSSYALAVNSNLLDYITIVSPARAFTGGTFNSFTLSRDEAFWATSPKAWKLTGYRIMNQGENLKDLRSRIAFAFYKGINTMDEITVSNITLTDAGSTAKWIPNTGTITTDGTTPTIPMREANSMELGAEPNLLFVNQKPEYVFASTYGTGGVKTIKVDFELKIGSRTTNERYILAQTLEKMKYYKFSFNVTSKTITLSLSVYDLGGDNHQWQASVIEPETIGNPESTLTLGTWTIGAGWDDVDGGSESIG